MLLAVIAMTEVVTMFFVGATLGVFARFEFDLFGYGRFIAEHIRRRGLKNNPTSGLKAALVLSCLFAASLIAMLVADFLARGV